MHISSTVKRIVAPAIRHINQFSLDIFPLLQILRRVDEVRSTKLLRPLLLRIVDVHDDDLSSSSRSSALNHTQPDTSSAEDGHIGALLDTVLASCDGGSAVAGCDTAAKQARAVHGCLVGDFDAGDIRHDGVLREGRGTHEVEKFLALAFETWCTVWHHAFALCCADFAAEVRLAGFAELALHAFGCARVCQLCFPIPMIIPRWIHENVLEADNSIPGLDIRHALAPHSPQYQHPHGPR